MYSAEHDTASKPARVFHHPLAETDEPKIAPAFDAAGLDFRRVLVVVLPQAPALGAVKAHSAPPHASSQWSSAPVYEDAIRVPRRRRDSSHRTPADTHPADRRRALGPGARRSERSRPTAECECSSTFDSECRPPSEPPGASVYDAVIERLFETSAQRNFRFGRPEINAAARAVAGKEIANAGDLIYSYRYRRPFPPAVLRHPPPAREGRSAEWALRLRGRVRGNTTYEFGPVR